MEQVVESISNETTQTSRVHSLIGSQASTAKTVGRGRGRGAGRRGRGAQAPRRGGGAARNRRITAFMSSEPDCIEIDSGESNDGSSGISFEFKRKRGRRG